MDQKETCIKRRTKAISRVQNIIKTLAVPKVAPLLPYVVTEAIGAIIKCTHTIQ